MWRKEPLEKDNVFFKKKKTIETEQIYLFAAIACYVLLCVVYGRYTIFNPYDMKAWPTYDLGDINPPGILKSMFTSIFFVDILIKKIYWN